MIKLKSVQTLLHLPRRSTLWLAGFFLSCLALSPIAVAQVSPAGSWDFVIKGAEHGVAQVVFLSDGSLTGTAAFTYFGKRSVITNKHAVYTNIVAGADLTGRWAYDGTNRIMGYINEVWFANPTNQVTNGISFRGPIKPAKITLSAHGSQGSLVLQGVPLITTNDLSGTYVGSGRFRNSPFPFIEVSDFTPAGPNMYDVTGGGPGYTFTGQFLVSRQRYAAFYQTSGFTPDGAQVTVYAGPFNLSKAKGVLKGTDGVNTGTVYKLLKGQGQ